jgi:hypothetical protein
MSPKILTCVNHYGAGAAPSAPIFMEAKPDRYYDTAPVKAPTMTLLESSGRISVSADLLQNDPTFLIIYS